MSWLECACKRLSYELLDPPRGTVWFLRQRCVPRLFKLQGGSAVFLMLDPCMSGQGTAGAHVTQRHVQPCFAQWLSDVLGSSCLPQWPPSLLCAVCPSRPPGWALRWVRLMGIIHRVSWLNREWGWAVILPALSLQPPLKPAAPPWTGSVPQKTLPTPSLPPVLESFPLPSGLESMGQDAAASLTDPNSKCNFQNS